MDEDERYRRTRERLGIGNLPPDQRMKERNSTNQAANPTKGSNQRSIHNGTPDQSS